MWRAIIARILDQGFLWWLFKPVGLQHLWFLFHFAMFTNQVSSETSEGIEGQIVYSKTRAIPDKLNMVARKPAFFPCETRILHAALSLKQLCHELQAFKLLFVYV